MLTYVGVSSQVKLDILNIDQTLRDLLKLVLWSNVKVIYTPSSKNSTYLKDFWHWKEIIGRFIINVS